MRGTWSFLIKAKPALVEFLGGVDQCHRYLEKDLIITAQLSDRHGMEFGAIFEQIKKAYMLSVQKSLPKIGIEFGFDHYWTFEKYHGLVITLSDIFQTAELVKSDSGSNELNYLIQTNAEV